MSSPINIKSVTSLGYDQIPTDTLTAFVESQVVFGSLEANSKGAYNTSTGEYVCPERGLYSYDAVVTVSGGAVTPNNYGVYLALEKNNVKITGNTVSSVTSVSQYSTSISFSVLCEAGDVLTLKSRCDLITPIYDSFFSGSSLAITRISEGIS